MTTVLAGNVSIGKDREAELKETANGTAVVRFPIAVDRKVGEETRTSYHSVVVYGDQARNVAESLKAIKASTGKNPRVIVSGRLETYQQEIEGKDGKMNIDRTQIVADEVAISMRWSKVESVVRTARASGAGVDEDAANEASAPAAKAKASSKAAEAGGDDEPF